MLVKDVDANGNGVSPYTHSVPIIGTLFDYLGWSGGSFIDSDSGKVVVKDSNFNENNGDGLEVYATGGDLILKDVAAKENLGTGAKLNTFLDLNGLELGTGSILIFGDEVDFDAASDGVYSPKYTTLFDMNEETGLNATSGGEILLNGVEANDNGHTLVAVVPATPYNGADLLALGSLSDPTADASRRRSPVRHHRRQCTVQW